jgi:hypothetical protein
MAAVLLGLQVRELALAKVRFGHYQHWGVNSYLMALVHRPLRCSSSSRSGSRRIARSPSYPASNGSP